MSRVGTWTAVASRSIADGLPRALALAPALLWAAAPLLAVGWAWLVPVVALAVLGSALVPAAAARSAAGVLVLVLAAAGSVRTQAVGALWVTVLALLLAGWLVLGERWPPRSGEGLVPLAGLVLLCGAGAALVAAVAVAGPRGGLPLLVLGLLGGAVAYRLAAGRPG